MDVASVFREFARTGPAAFTAVRAVDTDREAMLPALIGAIEDYVDGNTTSRARAGHLFMVFHLLGAWRETRAYRPLARLLACPSDALSSLLGDAITETSHRVMAAVFDGDPDPIYGLILNRDADEFVRSRMCELVAMLVVDGRLSRDEALRFLAACFERLQADHGNTVWDGWQNAIALAGLEELRPLVERAFGSEAIPPMIASIDDFDHALAYALANPDRPDRHWAAEYEPFGDAITELSGWYEFSGEAERDQRRYEAEKARDGLIARSVSRLAVPIVDRYRHVGRNDPCPCGSRLKYKRCCLN